MVIAYSIIVFVVSIEEIIIKLASDNIWIYLIVWLFFAKWAFETMSSIKMITGSTIFLMLIVILLRGMITYFVLDYAFIFFYFYLLIRSFLGFSLIEYKLLGLQEMEGMDLFMKIFEQENLNSGSILSQIYLFVSRYFLNGWNNVLLISYLLFFLYFLLFILQNINSDRIIQAMTIVCFIFISLCSVCVFSNGIFRYQFDKNAGMDPSNKNDKL
jgi:hypothetical protein